MKVNGETYVLCSYQTESEENIKEEIGTVNYNGTAAKYKGKYYVFSSIDSENWGNGVQISLNKEK